MDKKTKIGIIIPSLDPDEKFLHLLSDLHEAGYNNVIIVNDGSNNNYDNYFREAQDKYGYTVLKHSVNQGKGRAIKTAFNYILNQRDDLMGALTVDSDGQHTIEDIESCSEALYTQKDKLIMGCRNFSKGETKIPFRSRFGNIATHKVLKILCGIDLSDTQTGLRGFSRNQMKTFMKTKGEGFEYEMHMILDAHEKNIEMFEVPINTVYIEENETSHFNPLLDSLRIYSVFFKFIISSASSFLIDIIMFTALVAALSGVIPHYIAVSTYSARVVSALFNYIINKNKVFNNKTKGPATLFKYIILCVIIATTSAFCTTSLFTLTHINVTLIKIVVDTILFFLSFRIQRSWVFKGEEE